MDLRKPITQLEETAIRVTWSQWDQLGASIGSVARDTGGMEKPADSVIDPEALLLLSLSVTDRERRLQDIIRWWAEVGSHLTSVQRVKSLVPRFPECTRKRLAAFAGFAVEAGDRRWKRYVNGQAPEWPKRGRKGPDQPRLTDPATLLLRLRAGFGVNAKADALSYLLGIGRRQATIKEIAQATNYSKVALLKVMNDMALAGFTTATDERPARYAVRLDPWKRLLDLPSRGPDWHYASHLFPFVARSVELLRRAEKEKLSPYLVSTQARDLRDEFRHAFQANLLDVPDPTRYRGEEYLEGFRETISRVSDWLEVSVAR